jgi:hypothetical protein
MWNMASAKYRWVKVSKQPLNPASERAAPFSIMITLVRLSFILINA